MNNTPSKLDILLSEYITGSISPEDMTTVLEYLQEDQELATHTEFRKSTFTVPSKTQHDVFFENAARNTSVHVLQSLQNSTNKRFSWKVWFASSAVVSAAMLCIVLTMHTPEELPVHPVASPVYAAQQAQGPAQVEATYPTPVTMPVQTQTAAQPSTKAQLTNVRIISSSTLDEVLEDALVDAMVYVDQHDDVWAVDEKGISILLEQISHDSSL